MLDEVFEALKTRYPITAMLKDITGPHINPWNGKTYFEGIVDDGSRKVKIAFDIKYVEYGKSPISEKTI